MSFVSPYCEYPDCEKFKENSLLPFCATHNKDARTPVKIPKEKKPIRKESPERAKENREYLILRKQFLKEYPICAVKDCQAKSTEVHHKKDRTNDWLLDQSQWLQVCADHHRQIEMNPVWAKSEGYSISRNATI